MRKGFCILAGGMAMLAAAATAARGQSAVDGILAAANFQTLRAEYQGVIQASTPPRSGPPLPGMAVGIGPGSHLIIGIPNEGTFGCTANFVWKDTTGKYYLGAAGHCFLPADKTATHGPGADYSASSVTVDVCVSGCTNGGQSGFIIVGSLLRLGHVAYARQALASDTVATDIGNDFGLVRIPDSAVSQIRAVMPVWNGPTTRGKDPTLGNLLVLYGNAAGLGEIYPTMARAGVFFGHDGKRWFANGPSLLGDSGAAVEIGHLMANAQALEGKEAAGILTHLAAAIGGGSSGSLLAGTLMSRAVEMAGEAGLSIVPLCQSGASCP